MLLNDMKFNATKAWLMSACECYNKYNDVPMPFVDIVIKFPALFFFYLSGLKLYCTEMTTVTK